VPSVLGRRYDAFLYFEDTPPLRPLHLERASDDEAQTWPWGV
jgi:erythromycin esterase